MSAISRFKCLNCFQTLPSDILVWKNFSNSLIIHKPLKCKTTYNLRKNTQEYTWTKNLLSFWNNKSLMLDSARYILRTHSSSGGWRYNTSSCRQRTLKGSPCISNLGCQFSCRRTHRLRQWAITTMMICQATTRMFTDNNSTKTISSTLSCAKSFWSECLSLFRQIWDTNCFSSMTKTMP